MTTMADHNGADLAASAGDCVQISDDVGGTTAASMHNGREARNLAEKQRRDKLNASIQELSTMVPHVAESTRRLDKTAVLRFATHGLRLEYVFGRSASRRKRRYCPKDDSGGGGGAIIDYRDPAKLTDALTQLLDSFFLTLTCNGQIVLISASVEQLLGHCQSDLYGQNIMHITHPEDQALLRQQLIPRDISSLFERNYPTPMQTDGTLSGERSDEDEYTENVGDPGDKSYRPNSPRTLAHLTAIDERLRADRRCFTVRLARASTRSEASRNYELVKIDGCFRRSDSSVTGGSSNFPIVSQLIRRSRNNNVSATCGTVNGVCGSGGNASNGVGYLPQHDAIAQAALHGISGNDVVLVAMGRIIREPRVLYRQPEANQLEYSTRHLIDGRIIDCDQRIGIVAGYMKDEVRNLSPFSFMHQDDVRWVIVALRQMYDCNSDYGESCYRLLSRNGHFIYLQTKGYLEIDKSSNKVHSFLCINTLLDEEEGKRKVQEMKNKFSTIINAKIPSNSQTDQPASRNPQQLERIVLYLIENLQKSSDNNNSMSVTLSENGGVGGAGGAGSALDGGGFSDCDMRSPCSVLGHEDYAQTPSPSPTQTAPLALVPPEPSSVKNSITKSVNVVNITAAKTLQYQQRSPGGVRQHNDMTVGQTTATAAAAAVKNTTQKMFIKQKSMSQTMDSSMCVTTPPSSPVHERVSVLQRLPLNITITTTTQPTDNVDDTNTMLMSTTQLATMNKAKDLNEIGLIHQTPPASASSLSSSPASSSASPPTKLYAALSSSFRQIDNNLQTLGEEAQTLYQQRTLITEQVPCKIERQFDAIFVEHQKQKQLLINIKSEYDVHLHQQLQQQQHQQQQQPLPTPPLPVLQQATVPETRAAAAASVIASNVLLAARPRQNRRPL